MYQIEENVNDKETIPMIEGIERNDEKLLFSKKSHVLQIGQLLREFVCKMLN